MRMILLTIALLGLATGASAQAFPEVERLKELCVKHYQPDPSDCRLLVQLRNSFKVLDTEKSRKNAEELAAELQDKYPKVQ